MYSHIFSVCCNAPVMMGNICSACNNQAELYEEPKGEKGVPYNDPWDILHLEDRLQVGSVINSGTHFSVDSGKYLISHADMLEWGRVHHLWSPTFIQHHLDDSNDEDYESLYQWYPFGQVPSHELADVSDLTLSEQCSIITDRRKTAFLNSVNEKTMEDYLCQLQRQMAES